MIAPPHASAGPAGRPCRWRHLGHRDRPPRRAASSPPATALAAETARCSHCRTPQSAVDREPRAHRGPPSPGSGCTRHAPGPGTPRHPTGAPPRNGPAGVRVRGRLRLRRSQRHHPLPRRRPPATGGPAILPLRSLGEASRAPYPVRPLLSPTERRTEVSPPHLAPAAVLPPRAPNGRMPLQAPHSCASAPPPRAIGDPATQPGIAPPPVSDTGPARRRHLLAAADACAVALHVAGRD
jgi:hypothetical protein